MLFQNAQVRRWGLLLAAVFLPLGGFAFAGNGPSYRVEPPVGALRAGEPFEVTAVAFWKGDGGHFKVTPGELAAPEWGEGGWERVEARVTPDGTTEQRFVARFTAAEPGEVSVPSLRLLYVNTVAPAEGESGAKASLTLQGEPFSLTIRADYRWLYPYIALGVMLAGLGVAGVSIWIGRRRAAAQNAPDPLAPWRTVEDSLHNARRHRLDGDFYAYYRELERIVQFAGGEVKAEFGGKMKKMVEAVGYQGHRPADDEIEGTMKDLERALARWKEGKAA